MSKRMVRSLNEFQRIDELLGTETLARKIYYIIAIIFFNFLVISAALIASIYFNDIFTGENNIVLILHGISFWYNSAKSIITDITVGLSIGLVGCYIETIQTSLKSLAESSLTMHRKICYHFEEKDISFMSQKIREIRMRYGKINDLKTEINQAISLQLLLILTSVFLEIVFFSFFGIIVLQYGRVSLIALSDRKLIIPGIWVCIHGCKLLFIIWICNFTANKGKEMGVTVHRMFDVVQDRRSREEVNTVVMSLKGHITGIAIFLQLSIFSMELFHRSPDISAKGFFSVDYTLLYAVSQFGMSSL